jgi:guanylate kinase
MAEAAAASPSSTRDASPTTSDEGEVVRVDTIRVQPKRSSDILPVHNKRSIIICAPSGCGKTTLVDLLVRREPDVFGVPVSDTTRAPRAGEAPGVAYHFINEATFRQRLQAGEYIEHAYSHGHSYGLTHAALHRVQVEEDKTALIILNVHGVEQIRRLGLPAYVVWLSCPSEREQRQRLEERGDDADSIAVRLKTTQQEQAFYEANRRLFDASLVNDVLAASEQELRKLAHAFL